MDNLLNAMHDVAVVVLPTLGAICLVILIMILVHILKIVKQVPKTLNGLDDVLASTKDKVDKLEQPLNAFSNVANTVDKVNNSAVGFASKAMQFGIKNSDLVSSFFSRGDVGSDVASSEDNSSTPREDKPVVKEEDFGIYG